MREHVSVIDIEHRWSCKIIIDSSMKICISEDESIAIYMKKCFYGLSRVCRLQSVAQRDTFSSDDITTIQTLVQPIWREDRKSQPCM